MDTWFCFYHRTHRTQYNHNINDHILIINQTINIYFVCLLYKWNRKYITHFHYISIALHFAAPVSHNRLNLLFRKYTYFASLMWTCLMCRSPPPPPINTQTIGQHMCAPHRRASSLTLFVVIVTYYNDNT